MEVLITGDSHTSKLNEGYKLLISKGEWPEEVNLSIKPLGGGHILPTPFFKDKGNYAEICNPEYCKQYTRFPPKELENNDVIYGFTSLFHTARVRRKFDWVNFVPMKFIINEAPISNALLDQVILDDCQYILKFIDIILRAQNKVFVIEAPKPFRHDYALGSTRVDVYTYIDSYYRNFITQELNKRNIPIVLIPREFYDETGFMLNRYKSKRKNDTHHGNENYGTLMMQKVLKFLLEKNI